MDPSCKWCAKPRQILPSDVLICTTCDLTPTSSLPNGHLLRKVQK